MTANNRTNTDKTTLTELVVHHQLYNREYNNYHNMDNDKTTLADLL